MTTPSRQRLTGLASSVRDAVIARDRQLAALAHAAGLALVSNDSDLLDATRREGLTVVRPTDFAKLLEG